MFKSILIANRGEIARRIIKTARRLGIKTYAVYSEADKNSLHVKEADDAFFLGPAASKKSYLNMKKIIDVALENDITAIHPGYGFLSENYLFAKKVEESGVKFIGPSWKTIKTMGNKNNAKKSISSANIPLVKGFLVDKEKPLSNKKRAKDIGFPVIAKAAAGGGGIGMQIVNKADEFEGALKLCQSRAKSAFGDSRVFVEKYIEGAQHVEFQVLGDGKKAIHFGERFCSIQRRHQKLVEEGPWLSDEKRAEIGALVCAGAESVGYKGLATFEFLRDSNGDFYFLEVNPRVQVEHTVTELITGYNLVELGIRVAQGEDLPITQDDVVIRGHAIQCRLNAEDTTNFIPSPGRLWECHFPSGFGIRCDTHAHPGYEMPGCFDSLLAKLLAWGPDRESAIKRMRTALDETIITGVDHLIPLHRRIMDEEDFLAGDITIAYIDEHEHLLG